MGTPFQPTQAFDTEAGLEAAAHEMPAAGCVMAQFDVHRNKGPLKESIRCLGKSVQQAPA